MMRNFKKIFGKATFLMLVITTFTSCEREISDLALENPFVIPTPLQSAVNVSSVFSTEYENEIDDVVFNLYWTPWQTTEGDTSGNVVSYTNFNFVGWNLAGGSINTTDKTHLHVDVFPINDDEDIPVLTSLGIEFEAISGSKSKYTISGLTPGEWNSIDIPLSSFSDQSLFANTTDYRFLILDGGNGGVGGDAQSGTDDDILGEKKPT